jgi:DNA-binding transcriptional ArsR family regulator
MEKFWNQGRIQERVLKLDAVRARPGIHLRGLQRDLRMPIGSLEHHLRLLLKHQLVVSHKDGRRRSYYPSGQTEQEDIPWLHCLRQDTWRRLLAGLLDDPEGDVDRFSQRLGLARSTVAYHLRRLNKAGLVERVQIGRDQLYQLAQPDRLRRILDQYAASFGLTPRDAEQPSPFHALLERVAIYAAPRATLVLPGAKREPLARTPRPQAD